MDIYTFIIAFSGVTIVYTFIDNMFMKKANMKPRKLYIV